MTQLDVPQLSLSRYVDLLKRRRWQVIPVSILGLLIGGIVAFFIPRYFVANTTVKYRHPAGSAPTDRRDPFAGVVDTVKLTMPLAIGETIRTLGWPEAATADPYEFSENCKAIDGRLTILEEGDSRDRGFVLIRVYYKDRDGLRAPAFLNQLTATWIAQQESELRADAERKRALAVQEQSQANAAFDRFLENRRHLQATYHILPDLDLDAQKREHADRLARQAEARRTLDHGEAELAGLRGLIAHKQTLLRDLPARVPVDPQVLLAEAAKTDEGKALAAEVARLTMEVTAFHEGTRQRAWAELKLASRLKRLQELRPAGLEVDENGTLPNPAREALRLEIEALEAKAAEATARLVPMRAALAEQDGRLQRMAEGYVLYDSNERNLAETERALEDADAKVRAANDTLGRLTNEPSLRQEGKATVPPAPTDPNLLLVALIGCVIGLLAAIALILLLDVVQATFKTVDDVERGLDVPVLGGISHLETEAQRRTSARARRRATLFAAAVLMLVSGVVLIYYYDPTRLPPFVRDMLAIVLGTA